MKFTRKHNARLWSNDELREVTKYLNTAGDIINVSGWKDEDREGAHYKDYFPSFKDYHISNYDADASRGSQNNKDITINLDKQLPKELYSKYEIVFNHTVLEHLQNPVFSFEQIARLSNDIVITIVPFKQHLHFDPPYYYDYYRFTPFAMRKLYNDNGLTVLFESHTPFPAMDVYLLYVGTKLPERHIDFPKKVYNINEINKNIGKNRWYGYLEHFAALVINKIQ